MAENQNKYMKISYETRIQILDLIQNRNWNFTDTAKELGLKKATVRAIYLKY